MAGVMAGRRTIENTTIADRAALVALGASWPIVEIFDYWGRIRPAPDALPGRQHFDPVAIPALLRYVSLIEVDPVTGACRYTVFASESQDVVGFSPVGRDFDDPSIRDSVASTRAHVEQMRRERRPLYRAGFPSMVRNEDYPYMQRIYLPMARDGVRVDMVLGVSVVYHRLAR